MKNSSIFENYYTPINFEDRFSNFKENSITVIIPTIHTNELWEANLLSIYREIPVYKLLIGDGGCIDDTIPISKKFPRVTVYDHRSYKSLGYSIRKLIEAVETDWFIYLHSDVYLPTGWFDSMIKYKGKYDWFGCRMQETIMIERDNDYGERPYAGSQIGRTAAFADGVRRIDDDYVYRQEDFIFSDIVLRGGFKEGKIEEVFHYHQTIKKVSPHWNPRNIRVKVMQDLSDDETVRVWDSQFRGIIKYLMPTSNWLISNACYGAYILIKMKVVTTRELFDWVAEVNPAWISQLKRGLIKHRIKNVLMLLLDNFKACVRKFIN